MTDRLPAWRAHARALQAQRWRWQPWQPARGVYLSLPVQGVVQGDDEHSIDEALSAFDDWCARHPGERCELALGAAATLWQVVQTERPGADALAAAWDLALEGWAHYLDVDLREPERLAAWQLQEAQGPGFCLLGATPLALSLGLLDVARGHGVKVDWMGPWWVRGLARALAAEPQGGASTGDEGAAAPRRALRLSEPGWHWRARMMGTPASSSLFSFSWAWRTLGRGRRLSTWTLADLGVDSGDEMGDLACAEVRLDAPGLSPDHASCADVDLAVLQGTSPLWECAA